MRVLSRITAAFAVLTMSLLLTGAAMAQSTHLYPASDTVSMGSAPATLGGLLKCTFHGGTIKLPATGSSGAVTLSYTELPSFTACAEGYTVTVSGPWTISAEYGTDSGKITIPANGFVAKTAKGEIIFQNTQGSTTMNATWNNGFSSPVNVGSAMEVWGSPSFTLGGGNQLTPFAFGPALVSLTDVTHPASLPVLGP
jgi:hypothetical protein